MLATRVRDKPCRARLWRSSLGRVTVSTPASSRAISIGGAIECDSVPLGPRTVTSWPSMLTSTPAGMVIGSLPIRDMASAPLPDEGEDFPAHAPLGGLTVSQQAGRRRDDRHAESTEGSRQAARLGIDTE